MQAVGGQPRGPRPQRRSWRPTASTGTPQVNGDHARLSPRSADWKLAKRPPCSTEQETSGSVAKVAVIGKTVARPALPRQPTPIGQTLRIRNIPLQNPRRPRLARASDLDRPGPGRRHRRADRPPTRSHMKRLSRRAYQARQLHHSSRCAKRQMSSTGGPEGRSRDVLLRQRHRLQSGARARLHRPQPGRDSLETATATNQDA